MPKSRVSLAVLRETEAAGTYPCPTSISLAEARNDGRDRSVKEVTGKKAINGSGIERSGNHW